ncbi:MAG TPA: peptidyl-prolyl cis-trans isomerase [Roseimicrobium sp.]|nr:peptidyl-prolyl cis-trans isomerase [Roseimicrobium sp.]
MKITSSLAGLLLCLALAVLPAGAADAKNLFADEVVAKGKDIEIKRSQLDDAVSAFRATLAAGGQQVPEAERESIEQRMLDRLIFTRLVLKKATDAERTKGKAAATKFIEEFRSKMPSEEVFKRRLEANGMTVEQFRSKAEDEAVLKSVIDREVGNSIKITDEQVKKYYDENPQRFEQPEGVKILVIMQGIVDAAARRPLPEDLRAAKRANIERVLVRAKAGEDFAKLVTEFSEDESSKSRGGEFSIARGQTPPEFETAAFGLEPGKLSGIVTTRNGYYVLKMVEKLPAKKLPLGEVSAVVREGLLQQEIQNRMPDYFTGLKKEAGVEIVKR